MNRLAFSLQGADAGPPDHSDHVIAATKALLALISAFPPERHLRLDLIELLEGAIEIKRKQLVCGDPIGEKRRGEDAPGVAEIRQGPWPRKVFDVPKVSPVLRLFIFEFVRVESQQGCIVSDSNAARIAGIFGKVL